MENFRLFHIFVRNARAAIEAVITRRPYSGM